MTMNNNGNTGFFIIAGEKYILLQHLAELLGVEPRKLHYWRESYGLPTISDAVHFMVSVRAFCAWLGKRQHDEPENKVFQVDLSNFKLLFNAEYEHYSICRFTDTSLQEKNVNGDHHELRRQHKRRYEHIWYSRAFEKLWRQYIIAGGRAASKKASWRAYIALLETGRYAKVRLIENVVSEPLYKILQRNKRENENIFLSEAI